MSIKPQTVTIYVTDRLDDTIVTVPDTVYNLLKNDYPLSIKAGIFEQEINCHRNSTTNTIAISKNLAGKCGLSHQITTNLIVENNKLSLGPVIGVFTSVGQVRKANLQDPIFRLTELVRANEEARIILYFFSIKDVDFAQKHIRGTYYDKKTCRWLKKNFPYPDVLYDRGGGALKSQKLKSDKIREHLNTHSNSININPRYFFDKWDVYNKLAVQEEIARYLPHTELYETPEDLHIMLDAYSAVYVKESSSNNGRGVFRVKRLAFGMFELSYYKDNLVTMTYNSFKNLLYGLNSLLSSNKVIIQAAIEVLQVENCNVDLRALVQRNGRGEMEIGVLPVRMSRAGYPITNTRTGAKTYKWNDFLTEKLLLVNESKKEELLKKTIAFLTTCFQGIEKAYCAFGEIGIDFAFDKELNIWFIECNAKPGKDTLYTVYGEKVIKRAFINPLEYGKYLAGF
ncbi:YheC/YheD family endospore coat-associated protein [Dethiobacter alkaliphilus]|uniref:YheD n=1 Tax=Dethiobacter alkaliphilus AHT 1 TaxID=555088 RepID=C0GER5_DETAL|nr:YheC/YheD family protein [Dethiobacter alkaliphilus]EEG78097.1 conserved hypothetical protein [Dethiobacter alkaliphilus AHT 1]